MKTAKSISSSSWGRTVFLGLILFLVGCAGGSADLPEPAATDFTPSTATLTAPPPASVTSPPETANPTTGAVSTAEDDQGAESTASLPDPGNYRWNQVAEGLTRPVGLVSAGDGSGWLFVLEQPGRIRIIEDGKLISNPFLDIRDQVGDSGNEQGLLGLAFHPRYEENGYFFINYTDNQGDTVVSRFQVSAVPDQADAGSEEVVLTIAQPYGNHNGGQVSFGPEGYLWISTGDGGLGGDPQGNAQNLNTLLGKLLRIQVDQLPYTIPEDNPFGDEIWAYGLRNPWRFTHDPLTGELYIADVGQNQWEEVNYLPAAASGGVNFGWNFREGAHPFEGTPPDDVRLIDPVAEYDHSRGCSISGGAVYRGSLPAWQGVYLYGDYCTGTVWGLLQEADGGWQNEQLFSTDYRISAVSQDAAGEVYLLDISGGIYQLEKK